MIDPPRRCRCFPGNECYDYATRNPKSKFAKFVGGPVTPEARAAVDELRVEFDAGLELHPSEELFAMSLQAIVVCRYTPRKRGAA